MTICYIYGLVISEKLVQCDTTHTVQNIWLTIWAREVFAYWASGCVAAIMVSALL